MRRAGAGLTALVTVLFVVLLLQVRLFRSTLLSGVNWGSRS
jgi:hypothetical protein